MTSDALTFASLHAKDDLTLYDWQRLAAPPRALRREVTWRIRYGRRGAAVAWVLFTLALLALVYAFGLGDWRSGFGSTPVTKLVHNDEIGRDEEVRVPTPPVPLLGLKVPRPEMPVVIGATAAALLLGLVALLVTTRNNGDLAFLADGVLTEAMLVETQPVGEASVDGRVIPLLRYRYRYAALDGAEHEHVRTGMEGAYPARTPLLYLRGKPARVRIPTPVTGLWPRPEFIVDADGQAQPVPGAPRALLLVPVAAALAFAWALITILSNLVFAIIGG